MWSDEYFFKYVHHFFALTDQYASFFMDLIIEGERVKTEANSRNHQQWDRTGSSKGKNGEGIINKVRTKVCLVPIVFVATFGKANNVS